MTDMTNFNTAIAEVARAWANVIKPEIAPGANGEDVISRVNAIRARFSEITSPAIAHEFSMAVRAIHESVFNTTRGRDWDMQWTAIEFHIFNTLQIIDDRGGVANEDTWLESWW